MIAHCESIEARTGQGELIEAGVEWNEAQPLTEAAIHKVGEWSFYLSLMVFVLGLGMSAISGTPSLLILAGVALFGLAKGLFWVGWRVPGEMRDLRFNSDGAIVVPLGLSATSVRGDRLRISHAEIASIEAEQVVFPKGENPTCYTHGVRMFFRSGQVVHIAKDIEPDHAHMLAVRLSQALVGLREEMAIASMGMGSDRQERRGASTREVERVID